MGYIDTHSHIYSEEFDQDRDETIERARINGVSKIILPDIDAQSRSAMLSTCDQFPGIVFPLVGLHPTSVKENYREELSAVEKMLGTHQFYGIGECGLDFYWDTTFYKEQFKAFEHQLHLAKEMNFPIVIHSRDSIKEVLPILKKHPDVKGILHCFSGNMADAELACKLGYYLGVGGVVTFKNNKLSDIVQAIDINHILLETDSPYLAPMPYRGQRNESSYIPVIAQKIADITTLDIKKIEEITTENAIKLFNL